MSKFRSMWARRQGALDKAFGELFRIEHLAPAGQFLRGAPSVPPFDVTGILDIPDEVFRPYRASSSDVADLQLAVPVVDFDISQFSDAQPAPKKGTRITALESGLVFLVDKDPVSDGVLRITCQLTISKGAP